MSNVEVGEVGLVNFTLRADFGLVVGDKNVGFKGLIEALTV